MYKFILAFRYMFRKRISYFALAAVALCVFIVVVVMTIMNGLVDDFKQKNHSFTGDCVVQSESLVGFAYYEDFVEILDKENFIAAVSPVIKSYALVSLAGSSRNSGVEITGIDPVRHSSATGFGKSLYYHKNNTSKTFEPDYEPNLPGCVLGIDLVLTRNAKGQYNQREFILQKALVVSCFPLTAKGALSKAGTGLVNTKTFYYSDNSHSALASADSSVIYLPFEQAQLLCGMAGSTKRANAIHIKFKSNVKLKDGCGKVAALWDKFKKAQQGQKQAALLDAVSVKSWKDSRRSFIAAMEKEQIMLTIMFVLVGVTTVFIVFVVFYMITSHKSKDIGILKSVGVSVGGIVNLFSNFAILVGLLGSALGSFAGWLFLLKINSIEQWLFEHFQFQLWDRTIYAIGSIPNRIEVDLLAVVIASAILACLIGAVLPGWRAAKCKPVDILQVSQL